MTRQRQEWGRDGFHPKSSISLGERDEGGSGGILGEGGTKWRMAAASLHNDVLLDPKKGTSKRPMALMLTMIRWRAPEEAKWQDKYRVELDVTDGRNGGAQQTVWEILLEMEWFELQAGEKDQGAVALVLDLVKAFERVSLPVFWLGRRTSISRKILLVLCGYFEHQRRVQFEGCVTEPPPDHLAGSKWSCLLLALCCRTL